MKCEYVNFHTWYKVLSLSKGRTEIISQVREVDTQMLFCCEILVPGGWEGGVDPNISFFRKKLSIFL